MNRQRKKKKLIFNIDDMKTSVIEWYAVVHDSSDKETPHKAKMKKKKAKRQPRGPS